MRLRLCKPTCTLHSCFIYYSSGMNSLQFSIICVHFVAQLTSARPFFFFFLFCLSLQPEFGGTWCCLNFISSRDEWRFALLFRFAGGELQVGDQWNHFWLQTPSCIDANLGLSQTSQAPTHVRHMYTQDTHLSCHRNSGIRFTSSWWWYQKISASEITPRCSKQMPLD